MREWTARHWSVAALVSAVVALVTGAVTGLVPNPLFTRMIEAPWWSYPVWIVSAVLSGLLVATYLAPSAQSEAERTRDQRRNVVGAVLSFLAVGCPTCNKLVVLALGTSGAITWFGPLQPVLAIGSLALLGFALRARLRSARICRLSGAGRP
ncbi:hypothetical protein SAMN02982929_02218 [Saccharopolyspora kobensis]|uniref:Uncharacterized protein n=1 Tax=Saccharopolyspora kobensis TaxID=146035 RepID=A0A1H6A9R6_9PSEU|nr:hypothetical protein [Saccharopolyspora kobensis]SEG45448.1 hypothetical protein SAMN02982929_02218 [Saccharopolyspora kobensis]SFE52979.1 hypothetical protein SAMN05216506_11252 [Saccharopolyspora kobensis]